MKAIMTIPSKVFETVKDRVLGTWFKDDEPMLERISTKNRTTVCTFETDKTAHIRYLESEGYKFLVEETVNACSLDGEFNTLNDAKMAIEECVSCRASDTDAFTRLKKYYPESVTQIPVYEEFRVWAIHDDNEELLYIRRVKTVYHANGKIEVS